MFIHPFPTVKASLEAAAVFIKLIDGDSTKFVLVTRSKDVINYFNEAFANIILNADEHLGTLDVYEIRFDKIITINNRDVIEIEYVSMPMNIPPHIYAHPEITNPISSERMMIAQDKFLKKVKAERDRGCYISEVHSESTMNKLLAIRNFFEKTYNIKYGDHPLFDIFEDPYTRYNYVSNHLDGQRVLSLYNSVFFLPIILKCKGLTENDISSLIPSIIDESIFTALKEEWIAYLQTSVAVQCDKFIKELNGVEQIYIDNFVEIIAKDVADIGKEASLDSIKQLVQFSFENYERFDIIAEAKVDANTYQEIVPDDIRQAFGNFMPTSAMWIIAAAYRHFSTMASIKEQYKLMLNTLQDIDFNEELSLYNDHRLYLRYWPENLEINPEIHCSIRPFTTLENKILKSFIVDGIPFDINSLYDASYNYVNSIVDILAKNIDIYRAKRFEQVSQLAQVRVHEIKSEIEPMYQTFTAEEKAEFDKTIEDLGNLETYRIEIEEKTSLIEVMSYWPASLYPIPSNVLSV